MDEYFLPTLTDLTIPFAFPIDDVFQIRGRGAIVTGRVQAGQVRRGDNLQLVGFGQSISVNCTKIEMYRRALDSAQEGEMVGITLKGGTKQDVVRGMLLVKPGSVRYRKDFEAEVITPSFLGTDLEDELAEGGQFELFLHTMILPVTITTDPAVISAEGRVPVRIQCPYGIPISQDWRFALMSQDKTVGYGVIL